MRHRASKRHGNSHKYYSNSNGCKYCGKNIEGLPHRCKYCGQVHCSDHLLPEDHKCPGINQKRTFGFKKNNYAPQKSYEDRSESNYISETSYRPSCGFKKIHYKPHFEFPRIRFPRVGKLLSSFIIAIVSYFLAVLFIGNSIFLLIEFFACAYFTILLFKKPFRWANRVSMSDDLTFFGLRVLGFIVFLVGFYSFFAVGISALLVPNSAPLYIPIFLLVGGLVALGVFIAFRTNRRHQVVGIWRA